ncbi:DrmE family protein [Clostridium sp. AL.422]|uniref:DrmE family protein n=1 Tax=Clostridium TaxID=1485 RepID=UPI00293DC9E7|nr:MULTISPECIES: DrmE family protein [unclassified Clostridium]MDV4152120.1 DrmE family protein [Clostridium sp. AL.422]
MEKMNMIWNKLKEIDIIYNSTMISLNSFDEIIFQTINKIYESENKNNFMISIDDELTAIYMLVFLGIRTYYENMVDPNKNILDILTNNEKVCYKGDLYIYDGINELNKMKYIKLKGNKGLIRNIALENAFEITVYNGTSSRINKSKDFLIGTNITKKFIADIYNCDVNKLNGFINSSTLFVMRGKEKLLDIIESIEFHYDNKKIPFTELFPLGYWSSEENCLIVKNRIKEDLLFNVASNISTALDLIINDENISNVIVIGDKAYKDSLETEIRRINLYNRIKKLILVGSWENTNNFNYFISKDNKFDIYAVTKDLVLSNINFYSNNEFQTKSSIQEKNYKLIQNMIDKRVIIQDVEDELGIGTNILKVTGYLKSLCVYGKSNDDVLQFIKTSYHICNKLEYTIIPFIYCNSNYENINIKVGRLKIIWRLFDNTRVEYGLMKSVIEIIDEMLIKLNRNNNKFEELKKIIKASRSKTTLLIKNKDEIKDIERYLMMQRMNKLVKVVEYKKNIDILSFDNIIMPFYQEDLNIFTSNYLKDVYVICYEREQYKYKRDMKINKIVANDIYKNNKLECDDEYEYEDIDLNSLNDQNEELIVTEDETINDIIEANWIRIITSQQGDTSNKSFSGSKSIAKKIVFFKDGKYAFLSENYIVNSVDRVKNDISIKRIEDIDYGDELIFVVNTITDKNDIVKDTIDRLLEHIEFQKKYKKYFDNNLLWKDSLINYMKKNFLDEKDISNNFKIKGCDITALAIKNWLNGSIIGPQNSEHIKVIAKIIKNKILSERIDEVIASCKQVRSIQIQIRKAIARMIINSVVSGQNGDFHMYRYVKEAIGDLSSYAYIGDVISIKDIDKEIPIQNINRIIEGDE